MKELENEKIIWQSKNKKLLLTSHRLREIRESIFGSVIKSIMLEELTFSQLHISLQFKFLRQAIIYFLLINGSVYLLNQYLFKAELIKFFFGDIHIGAGPVQSLFYFSLLVSCILIILFFISFKKVFSFYASGMFNSFQLRWLDFEERENFISIVEDAKCKRHENLFNSYS